MRWPSPPESVAAERPSWQVAESDVVQEFEAFGDFVRDASGDGQFPAGQFDVARSIESARNRQAGEIGNRHAVYFDGQAFRTQTLAVAHRTFGGRHEIEQIFAIGFGSGGVEILPEVAENSQKPRLSLALAPALRLAVQQKVLNLVGKFLEGRRQVEADRLGPPTAGRESGSAMTNRDPGRHRAAASTNRQSPCQDPNRSGFRGRGTRDKLHRNC